jgi:ligand-binding sensor protein
LEVCGALDCGAFQLNGVSIKRFLAGKAIMMKLEEIIDLESLQKLQDYFAEATGFAAITVDYQGNPLLKYSSFSPFCEKMREKPDFYKKCVRSDAYVSLEAVRNGVSCIHRCHAGLIDFAIPIIVNGEYLASMMGGQVKTGDSLEDIETGLVPQQYDYANSDAEIRDLYDARPVVPLGKVRAAANFFHKTMSYIVNQYMLNKEKIDLLEKQKEKIKTEKSNRGPDDKTHVVQITPYFYFNALNAASTQAYSEGAEKTQEIICCMGDIGRFSMKNSGRAVPIGLELQNLKNHLLIHKVRFGDRMSFDCDVHDDILDYLIPAMLLPVFVENSIAHGLEKKDGPCHIRITGRMKEHQLFFEIEDDGAGMPRELVNLVNGSPAFDIGSDLKLSGIRGARKTLSHFFGNDFKLVFSSGRNTSGYAKVTLSFPARL